MKITYRVRIPVGGVLGSFMHPCYKAEVHKDSIFVDDRAPVKCGDLLTFYSGGFPAITLDARDILHMER